MSTCLQFTALGVRTLMLPRLWEINRDIFGNSSFTPINKHSIASEEKRARLNSKANCSHRGLKSGVCLDSEKIAGSFSFLKYHTFFRAVQLPRCRSIIIDACHQCPVSLFINNTYWRVQVKARTSDSCQDNISVESVLHSSYDFINKGTGHQEGVFVLFE